MTDYDYEPEPYTPPVVESFNDKVQGVLDSGESISVSVGSYDFNVVYDKFKPQRKGGLLRMEYDSATGIAKVTKVDA